MKEIRSSLGAVRGRGFGADDADRCASTGHWPSCAIPALIMELAAGHRSVSPYQLMINAQGGAKGTTKVTSLMR
jgi:hypothetical protein